MIEFKKVSFSYESGNGNGGLSGIELTIQRGEFVLLCGSSGCGKTTLTRLINGLIPHYYAGNLTGQVLVNGTDVSRAPLYETAELVGSVFQNPRSQFFNVDTTSEVAFGCENMGLPEEEIRTRVERATEELSLHALLNRSIFALSGGEKQKIACGSVAALDPQVMVLDEPSSNLDAKAIEELRGLLTYWKSQGKTIVISEHRLYYLSGLADRVLVMENGQLMEQYKGPEFYSLPKHRLEDLGLRVLSMESHSGATGSAGATEPQNEVITLCDFVFGYSTCSEVLRLNPISVPKGGIIAVIGHNGAGKSTFARCLCGLEKKCRASVLVNGCRLSNKERLKSCYMVMQDVNHQLFTESVLDEVLISMQIPDVEKARSILRHLDLLQLENTHPMSLSGGQKQRVAIASAVASERELIVFDEPTSGLDLQHMREVADCLTRLAEMGRTLFVITHDPELILSCCTHLLRLEKGSIKENITLDSSGMDRMLDYFLEAGGGLRRKEKEKVV
ncbi:ABC transporter ATP-binding protein [Paenibacillus turpanensis]|uniref:ABC transporter ATP-binding protein n=1 Tax=Paenibacillus turpanensis TaxID=2689078 RepID=UPI00140D8774|nr:energy-coupling factor ABC transporter ATP-binding protein [Paenibacillus turpanensis]